MEGITLGQIGLAITFIVGLVSGITYLKTHLHMWIADSLKDQFESIDSKIDKLQDRVDDVDMAGCKNFLVSTLANLEKGVHLDEIERERIWEQIEHYRKIGGNSYIQRKIENLQASGKL